MPTVNARGASGTGVLAAYGAVHGRPTDVVLARPRQVPAKGAGHTCRGSVRPHRGSPADPGTAGSRLAAGENTVARLMTELGLAGRAPKRRRLLTRPGKRRAAQDRVHRKSPRSRRSGTRPVVPRRRGTAGRARGPGRPRDGLPVGPALHPAAGRYRPVRPPLTRARDDSSMRLA
jgi:hypothetical protein